MAATTLSASVRCGYTPTVKRGAVTHVFSRALLVLCVLVLVVALVSAGTGFLLVISVFSALLMLFLLRAPAPALVPRSPRHPGRFSRAPPRF